jgi:hypothetical protein
VNQYIAIKDEVLAYQHNSRWKKRLDGAIQSDKELRFWGCLLRFFFNVAGHSKTSSLSYNLEQRHHFSHHVLIELQYFDNVCPLLFMQRGIRHRLGVSSHICWVSCCSCQSFWKLHWLSAAKWPEISAQIKDHLLLYCSCKGWTRQRLGVSSHLCCVGCCSCQIFWEYYWPNAAKWLEISIKTKDHQLFCKVVGHVDGTHRGLAVYVWFGSVWWIWMAYIF